MEGDTSPTAVLPRRRSSPSLLNPVVLIALIPTLTLVIIFLIIPLFISFTSNVTIKHFSIKKGWDSLNILLVLVAVLCGIFAKRNDDEVLVNDVIKSQPSDSDPWYEFYERQPVKDGNGMRRNSSSYPDLRQVSEWDNSYNQFRFFDDFELTKAQYNRHHLRGSEVAETDRSDTEVVMAETSGLVQSPPPPTLAAASLPLDEKVVDKRLIQSLSKHRRKERQIEAEKEQPENTNLATPQVEKIRTRRPKVRNSDRKEEKPLPPPQLFPPPTPAPPPPPPPPPPPSFYNIFKKKIKNKRVHSITGQPPPPPPPPPLPMSHIFNNMFKTGRKNKRIENPYYAYIPPPPPPPPPRSIFNNMFKTGSKSKRYENKHYGPVSPPLPPPPPRSIFDNMFKSVSKSKKFGKQHYISAMPPPPPPPPLPPMSSVFNDLFKTDIKSQENRFQDTTTNPKSRHGRPPLPAKMKSFYEEDENVTTLGESPVINIPPPPPLPPFMMAGSGFVARGDFVRIRRSVDSSRCSSPELEDVDLLSDNKMDGGDGLGSSVTCPSPDVNLKADSFIARLKGEWKLEKMNSIKKKQLSPRNEINRKSY